MLISLLIFVVSLIVLLTAAKFFTSAAEHIGKYFSLPSFVIGVFIVGIGTSLPELISGIIAVRSNMSEILAGNVIGSNVSNILLITGMAAIINKQTIHLKSAYLYIDLHFLLGSFLYFYVIAYDGNITWSEAIIGIFIFIIYSIYLIKGGAEIAEDLNVKNQKSKFPIKSFLILILSSIGIYFGAEYTISSLSDIAISMKIPKGIIAVTLLSLGTTLPELAVNITAIKQGKAEMAIGNILGSSVFNTLVIPSVASVIGSIYVPDSLLLFSLPMMIASGLLFYLLTQDKHISPWEGMLFVCLYILFLIKVIGL